MVNSLDGLSSLAKAIAGQNTAVVDPDKFTRFLAQSAQQMDGAERSFPRQEEDAISRLSREVQLLEQGHVGSDQVSPEARALVAQRFDQGPSLNPVQMASDYVRALPTAGRVLGEATLTAAYPISLAGSGAATLGAEKAGLGPGWQTAAGVVGGLAEGPRAVMGARKIAAPLGGIGNPLAGAGRNIAKSTQKLGKAEAQEVAAAAKAARGVVNLPRTVPQDAMTGPKQAFHGSGSGFGYEGKAATFFTSNPDVAAQYSTQHGGATTPQVFTRDLSNKRFLDAGTPNGKAALDTIRASVPIEQIHRGAPRIGESTKQLWQRQRDDEWRAIADKLRPMGYDGVRIPVDESPSGTVHDSYLLFEDAGVGNALMPPAPQPRTAGMAVPDALPPKEPPIPEGYVRLYRGETRSHPNLIEGERGRWWSTDRSDAERYMKEIFEQTDPPPPTARILYTDVSRAEAESIARGTAEHERLGATYKLKPSDRYINVDQDDLINKAKPLPSSSSLQSPAQPPTGQPPLQGTGLQRLTNFIKVQKPGNLRAATEAARKVELGRKSGGVQRALSGSGTPGERFVQGRVAQQGDLPASVFQPAAERTSVGTTGNLTQTVRSDVITTPEINTLYDTVQRAGLRSFDTQNATEALTKALVGELPTHSEIVLLRRTLGDEFADALMTHRPNAERYRDMIIETINLSRSLFQTVADFSGLLRQGGVFAASRPVRSAKNSPAFLRAAFSKKYFNEIQDSIRTHPNYQQSQDAGLFIANTGSDITLREEAAISRWIQKIPVVGWVPAASERSYVGGLNKLRFDTYNDMLNGWQKAGVQVTDEMKRDAAKVINFSTGRGTLGVAEEAAPYLNAVFYSPRFLTSRIQLPLKEAGLIYKAGRYAIKGDPKTALAYVNLARNTVSFVAAGMGILMLLKLREGPDLKVETDARSSDFGKITYKNTRYDFWAGYQQIARYTWQTMVAESKSIPESKTPNKVSKYNGMQQGIIPLRFIRSKLSPAAGFATDLKLGETIAGDEIAADKETVGRIAYSNLTPFFIQSLVDAANAYDDPKAALYGLPSASGVGVTTIESKTIQDTRTNKW